MSIATSAANFNTKSCFPPLAQFRFEIPSLKYQDVGPFLLRNRVTPTAATNFIPGPGVSVYNIQLQVRILYSLVARGPTPQLLKLQKLGWYVEVGNHWMW